MRCAVLGEAFHLHLVLLPLPLLTQYAPRSHPLLHAFAHSASAITYNRQPPFAQSPKDKRRNKKYPNHLNKQLGYFVRLIGLEPTRRETLDPKSSASTNFATGANLRCKGSVFLWPSQIFTVFFMH